MAKRRSIENADPKYDSLEPSWQMWISSHRNREGRIGLDPIDTNQEFAYFQGLFIKSLLTLRLRTRNVFILLFMSIASFIGFWPLLAILIEVSSGSSQIVSYLAQSPFSFDKLLFMLLFLILPTLSAALLLANVVASIIIRPKVIR